LVCHEAGAAAELATFCKEEKCPNIGGQYHFKFASIAVETLGPLNTSACQLFANLGRKISSTSGDEREGAFCSAESFGAGATPCQPLTARTDDLYPIVYYLSF